MAIFDGKRIRGIVGKVVFKDSKDKKNTVVQQAPVKVKQSKATKVSAKSFGQGSVLAGAIRRDMSLISQGFHDTKMSLRSDAVIRDCLAKCFDKKTKTYHFEQNSFELLAGFEFNIKSLVTNSLYVTPELILNGNQLIVRLPEIQVKKQLKFLKGSNLCEISVVVCFFALEQAMTQHEVDQSIEVETSQAVLPAHDFVFEVPEGCLCVAGLGLDYFNKYNDVKVVMTSKAFKPAIICGATITPGVFVDPGIVKIGNRTIASPWTKVNKMHLPGNPVE